MCVSAYAVISLSEGGEEMGADERSMRVNVAGDSYGSGS